jgi:hypothetical protein
VETAEDRHGGRALLAGDLEGESRRLRRWLRPARSRGGGDSRREGRETRRAGRIGAYRCTDGPLRKFAGCGRKFGEVRSRSVGLVWCERRAGGAREKREAVAPRARECRSRGTGPTGSSIGGGGNAAVKKKYQDGGVEVRSARRARLGEVSAVPSPFRLTARGEEQRRLQTGPRRLKGCRIGLGRLGRENAGCGSRRLGKRAGGKRGGAGGKDGTALEAGMGWRLSRATRKRGTGRLRGALRGRSGAG